MSVVELDGAYNVRDIGGLHITGDGITRHGVLYRGDSLDYITDNDAGVLFGRLGIRVIIDLRAEPEVRPVDWAQRSVSYQRFPLIDEHRMGHEPFPSDDPQELAKVYLNNVRDGAPMVAAVFEALERCLSAGEPCIFHCAAGRDRTGVIAALLLDLTGVRDSDIASDYVRSNHHAQHVTRRLAENPLYSNNTAGPQQTILLKRETILMFLELTRATFGSAREFLLECGVPAETLDSITEKLADSSPPA